MNRSSALRLLRQLEATGYVARDPVTKRYGTVGARFLQLASNTPDHSDLSELVDPVLRAVRLQYGEATMLALPARGSMVYAAFFPSPQSLGVRERLGAVRPMHASAVGKSYLAALDDAALDTELNRLRFEGGTDHAPRDRPTLVREIVRTRERGFGIDRDETSLGVSCVAVALWIADSLIGAFGLTGPTVRLPDALVEEIGRELKVAADGLRYPAGRPA